MKLATDERDDPPPARGVPTAVWAGLLVVAVIATLIGQLA